MNRLYVLTRSDLSPSQQAVQAGHAVASWCYRVLCQKDSYLNDEWDNGTLVYLSVPNEEALKEFMGNPLFRTYGNYITPELVEWREPDLGNSITSIAFCLDDKQKKIVAHLPLMKL